MLQAIRELMIETYVFEAAPRDVLKIENLVLMAADAALSFRRGPFESRTH
ncbi:MAG: hypothetical protein U9Q81_26400 [Pseudomonadota bacterium]|nr:hypothetical protein [Pseudomonadota bacterium]